MVGLMACVTRTDATLGLGDWATRPTTERDPDSNSTPGSTLTNSNPFTYMIRGRIGEENALLILWEFHLLAIANCGGPRANQFQKEHLFFFILSVHPNPSTT